MLEWKQKSLAGWLAGWLAGSCLNYGDFKSISNVKRIDLTMRSKVDTCKGGLLHSCTGSGHYYVKLLGTFLMIQYLRKVRL
jgi:hypothetical protein